MRALDLIIKKRDGMELSDGEIQFLIHEFTRGAIADYQMSAFAMSVFFQGMSSTELASLTSAMLHSGRVIQFSDADGFTVDKHSTGGVGDKISIPLAPAVAACGLKVPMIAGRGLGHTGGTLDKLEAIPGFSGSMSADQFQAQVRRIGCGMIAQTSEIAPADGKLYALRDVTGTVECIPLIASSIMSKKLAEGIKGLVLDVKFGSGAFMQDLDRACQLAQTMVDIGNAVGTRTVARLTDMSQPIGRMIGNALEIRESIDVLKGGGPADAVALVVELGAEMLVLGNASLTMEGARNQINEVLQNGKALAKFVELIEAQGGDTRVIDNYDLLPAAPKRIPVRSEKSGHLNAMKTRAMGMASVCMGGGRAQTTDVIDMGVGLEMNVRLGDTVEKDQILCWLHCNEQGEEQALQYLSDAFVIEATREKPPELFGPRIIAKEIK